MDKRGDSLMGEGIMMMYRLVLLGLVAFAILGVSSIFYTHDVETRDAEAMVLTKVVVDCIAPNGVLDLNGFPDRDRANILTHCGFSDEETERFYVEIEVLNSNTERKVGELSHGDSGMKWVKEIFDAGKAAAGIKKYKPGYYEGEYSVSVVDGENDFRGEVKTEVMINEV